MPYRLRPFLKRSIYHVFSRGNRKQPIFTEARDYQRFLQKIEEYRTKYSIDVLAYCLLPNHFHFLLKQLSNLTISKFMSSLLSSHSHYFSLKHQLPPGQFFQGRFRSRLIESEADLLNTSRYIHLNPVKEEILSLDLTLTKSRALRHPQIIRRLRTYPWSSYPVYLKLRENSTDTLNLKPILKLEKNTASYRRFIEAKISDDDARNLEGF